MTNNIISTPDITGNIGSCSTSSIENIVSYNLFHTEKNVMITNSCTGAIVKDYNYNAPSPIVLMASIAITLILFWLFSK
jgi:hypothetical protein